MLPKKNELKILDWKRTFRLCKHSPRLPPLVFAKTWVQIWLEFQDKVWQQTHEKIVFFYIIFFPLNFQLKRLSFTYRILIRRTPSEQSLNPKGNTHTRSHMICLIVVVFSGLMFERSYQLWNKHGGLRLSAQKSGLRGWVRAGFELSPVPCFVLWQDTI